LILASIFCNGLEESAACFIVKDMRVWGCVSTFEVVEEDVVRRDAVGIGLRLERLDQYCIRFTMEYHHNILVSTVCSRRESACVIGEDVVDEDHVNIDGVSLAVEGLLWACLLGQCVSSGYAVSVVPCVRGVFRPN
jgi:hypothetical protein